MFLKDKSAAGVPGEHTHLPVWASVFVSLIQVCVLLTYRCELDPTAGR